MNGFAPFSEIVVNDTFWIVLIIYESRFITYLLFLPIVSFQIFLQINDSQFVVKLGFIFATKQ